MSDKVVWTYGQVDSYHTLICKKENIFQNNVLIPVVNRLVVVVDLLVVGPAVVSFVVRIVVVRLFVGRVVGIIVGPVVSVCLVAGMVVVVVCLVGRVVVFFSFLLVWLLLLSNVVL